MTPRDDTDLGPIRLRLSNGVSAAEEFSASDARSLADGARRAFGRYVRRHGPYLYGRRPVLLLLQIAPASEPRTVGWFAPCRPAGEAVRYVEVTVSAELLERRPPDDWTEIWSWCQLSRAHDRALTAFAGRVARCLPPPPEGARG